MPLSTMIRHNQTGCLLSKTTVLDIPTNTQGEKDTHQRYIPTASARTPSSHPSATATPSYHRPVQTSQAACRFFPSLSLPKQNAMWSLRPFDGPAMRSSTLTIAMVNLTWGPLALPRAKRVTYTPGVQEGSGGAGECAADGDGWPAICST